MQGGSGGKGVPGGELDLSPEEMRRWTEAALERIVEHVRTLPEQPAGYDIGTQNPPAPQRLPPEGGTDRDLLLDEVFGEAVRRSLNTASPGYLAYVPGGGLLHAAVADLISASINRYVGVWMAAPLLARIELQVCGWLCHLMGLPDSSLGILTSGGSLSNWMAVVTARRERLPEDFLSGVIYTSSQAHHSVQKAALLAGFPERRVVSLATDRDFRLQAGALGEQVRRDRARGKIPFLVVAAAGTTNTGAVDDLSGLAALCREERLWLHVDAAYGGFFRLTPEGRTALEGIEQADSVTLDPHKGMFLPYGTGALLVRDGAALRRTHAVQGDYMPTMQNDPSAVDFSEHGPELSRPFRGLRVWLPVMAHGMAPFRAALQEKLELARHAADSLGRLPGIEMVAPPQLSTLAFRLTRPGLDEGETERLNFELLERVHRRGRVFLNTTRLDGRRVIRMCILSVRTHRDRVDEALDAIREESAAL